jgi:hypothetical protein
MSDDWTGMDANNILALAMNRYVYAFGDFKQYWVRRVEKGDGFLDSLRAEMGRTYSNGTEHEFAQERADYLLQAAPWLRRVLEEGVRSLTGTDDFDSFVSALSAGDSESVIASEDAIRKVPA